MLRLLKSIFAEREDPCNGLPEALLDAAIERAVDGTDRRLRALGNYRRRLREPVAQAVRHVVGLVDQLPAAAEISPSGYSGDPRLRAAFASPEHLGEILGRFRAVRDYLKSCPGLPPDAIFGLLLMSRQERQVLGMELDGELLKRDVLQTAVSFTDHRYLAPADSEKHARRAVKMRAFDFLLQKALERMGSEKARRGKLGQERLLLRRKLKALQSGSWGSDPLFSQADQPSQNPEALEALEAEIEAIDAELGRFGGIELGLEESFRQVEDTLGQPEQWLGLERSRLSLDYRGVKSAGAEEIEVCEVVSADGTRRTVILGWIPRDQLPKAKDTVKLGQAYLG
jgi:hypothetical protein